jgi:hypothetical protein
VSIDIAPECENLKNAKSVRLMIFLRAAICLITYGVMSRIDLEVLTPPELLGPWLPSLQRQCLLPAGLGVPMAFRFPQ